MTEKRIPVGASGPVPGAQRVTGPPANRGRMGVLGTWAAGAVFGLALAAPPGPMNAAIAEESAVRGWRAGFRTGLGAMTADACFLALTYVGVVTVLADRPDLRTMMMAVGGVVMLWFAALAARDAVAARRRGAGSPDSGQGFAKALILGLTNPYQVLFWVTVGVGLLEPGRTDLLGMAPYLGTVLEGLVVVYTGSPALVMGLFGGILAWVVAFPAAIDAAESRVATIGPGIAILSAAIQAIVGVAFLLDATRWFVDG